MAIIPGKVERLCDECARPKECNIIGLRSISEGTDDRYIFYICDSCLQTMADIGGSNSESILNILSATDAI